MASPLSPRDLDQIHAFHDMWRSRLLAEDFEGMTTLYTDDAVVMPPSRTVVKGKAQLLEFMRSFPRVTRADFEVDEIDGQGDVAYVLGRYAMTMEPEGAPGPVEDRGKFIEIRRKQPDGTWLLSRDIFNSDLDPSAS